MSYLLENISHESLSLSISFRASSTVLSFQSHSTPSAFAHVARNLDNNATSCIERSSLCFLGASNKPKQPSNKPKQLQTIGKPSNLL